ncbi:MAG: recombinase family protein [Terracidiphilus sp.]|jgi:DNA invertase Pin-like site-specific DNA recombinase
MTPRVHCAIYTRKSSEEGLEQSFNSLDAQREAALAFIQSQRHEGWHALNTHYDDGGFSGGNMDRPALKRLMADIRDGKINTVVVYKVDRLTRSLADFAKIIEQFDTMHVSFVSVTQQFNTTSFMGRLTLNVLLSFAQFEREVTGERIRDKIAASKKKGMWMGGFVPLGYDLRDRRIYVNPKEAQTIRTIYSNYLRLGCVMALKDYLDRNKIFSKSRTNGNGATTGGTSFSRGALYKILRNHIYVGEIAHKGGVYRGQHEAIIAREQWNQVQKLLIQNHQGKWRKARATKVSLFTGILFDATGNRYTPTHTNKSGRRYRYYTSQTVIQKAAQTEEPARIPAHDLEAAVTERILEFLKSPPALLKTLGHQGGKNGKYSELLKQGSERAASWTGISAQQRERFLKAILDRVVIHPDSVEVKMRKEPLVHYLAGKTSPQSNEYREFIFLHCPFRVANRGKALRLIVGNDQAPPQINTLAILKAIARARAWREQLISGEAHGVRHLASLNQLRATYVRRILPFARLGPASIEAILNGRVAPELSLESLVGRIPMAWKEQAAIIGSV